MTFILSGPALTTCESDETSAYGAPQSICAKSVRCNKYVEEFVFEVGARDWKEASCSDKYVEVAIPAVTDKIINYGAVMIYLNEGGKSVSLPFTYYQVRRALSFQPSYSEGSVQINVLGNFVLNIRTRYVFRVLVINPKGLKWFKGINWNNYSESDYVFASGN